MAESAGVYVLQQVDEHLLHEHRVHRDHRQLRGEIDGDRARCELRLEASERRAHQLLHGDPLALRREAAGLQPGHIEQVRHQALQALRLVADRVEQLVVRGRGQRSAARA